jgi:16S rRNA (guanine966-N2)-methyltransferase
MPIPWEECRVLDLFAGTGAIGMEALSRGVRACVFVDRQRTSLGLIKRNLDICGFSERTTVIQADIRRGRSLSRVLKEGPFDLIVADPPYGQGLGESALTWVAETRMLAPRGCMVVEEIKGTQLPDRVCARDARQGAASASSRCLVLDEIRFYAQTGLWFYRTLEDKGREHLRVERNGIV